MALPTPEQIAAYQNVSSSSVPLVVLSAQDTFNTATIANTQSNNLYLANVSIVEDKVRLSNANLASSTLAAAQAAASAALAASQAAVVTQAFNNTALYTDAALLTGGIYPDINTGINATPVLGYFSLVSANSNTFLDLYKVNGTSSSVVTYILAPSTGPASQVYLDTTETINSTTIKRTVITNGGTVTVTTSVKNGTATLTKTYPSAAAVSSALEDYTVENTFYVSANGNDTSTGKSWKRALRTIEAALAKAWLVAEAALVNNLEPPVQLIEWGPEGIVLTKGHLDMPDNCIIKAVHRTVFLRPVDGYEERNVFRMGSGCFLEGVMFEGWRLNNLDNPTEGFAVSFRPGAVINRVPYAHKIAVRCVPEWGKIAPPLDAENQNPLVKRAGGVVLADGMVCSQYSIFPNIMTWGATPVLPNGIGYCAKNGALINAVNAVSIWAHKHFLALNGGQIILSACSTQFGDYSLVADGQRSILSPSKVYLNTTFLNKSPVFKPRNYVPATPNDPNDPPVSTNDLAVLDVIDSLVHKDNVRSVTNQMFQDLVDAGYTGNWEYDLVKLETKTKSDSALLMQCLYWTLSGNIGPDNYNEQPMLDFAKGMFDTLSKPVYIVVDKLSEANAIPVDAGITYKTEISQIKSSRTAIINAVWLDLLNNNYTTGWDISDDPTSDKSYTLRDSGTLLTALENALSYSNEQYIADFIRGLYTSTGSLVISYEKMAATIRSFERIRTSVLALPLIAANSQLRTIITNLFGILISSLSFKTGLVITATSTANLSTALDVTAYVRAQLAAKRYFLTDDQDQELDTYINSLYNAVIQAIQQTRDVPVVNFARSLYSASGTINFFESNIPALVCAFNSVKIRMLLTNTDTTTRTDVTNLIDNLISNTLGNSNKYAFLFCWNYIKNHLLTTQEALTTTAFKNAVTAYMSKLEDNVLNPDLITEPSRITAIGHTWTAVMGGVALTKVPPANNSATIQDSIIERSNGVVIASGQDDQGNALFVGGLQISADTGELGGPPFDQAVRRVATKTAISRSF